MTTPNIEELIDRLYDWHNTSAEQNRLDMQKAADLLQSQAERIKGLEAEIRHKAPVIAAWRDKHDTLRAQIAAIAATEPVAWFFTDTQSGDQEADTDPDSYTREVATGYKRKQPLLTNPMLAQDVTELVDAFEHHIEQTRPIERSTIALSKYKGTK